MEKLLESNMNYSIFKPSTRFRLVVLMIYLLIVTQAVSKAKFELGAYS